MIRAFRLTLFFAVGLLLGGLFSFAYAETIPATQGATIPLVYKYTSIWNSVGAATPQEACGPQVWYANGCATANGGCNSAGQGSAYYCISQVPNCPSGYYQNGSFCVASGPTCPSGQNWTLSGSNCVRTDCESPQTREADGTCGMPCEPSQIKRDGQCVCDPSHLAAFPSAYGAAMEGTGSSPSSSCVGGCKRNTGSFCLGGGGSWWCSGGSWTSEKCTGGATDKPSPPDKKPPCAAGEGVLTSSSGKVGCVPEGTPNARVPKKADTVKRETLPDGTVKETTKSTVCDDATGACNTTTTTKTTAPDGSVSNAEATQDSGGDGAMGKGTGDNSGDEPGDCAKEPDSPLCKKGEVKEKGSFGTEQDGELDGVKNELRSKFAEIRAAATAMFSNGSAAGGGSLPCYAPVSVLGQSFTLCFTQYADKLSQIGGFVVFAAGLLAVFIVLRR